MFNPRQIIRHFFLLSELIKLIPRLQKLSVQTRLFCFFPYYQTGGSEQVHADILQVVGEHYTKNQIAIFFTKPSRSTTFRGLFYALGQCFEISEIDRSKYRGLLIKMIAKSINKAPNPTVFGANATLLYELIPYLHESVRIVDLTHSFVPESDNPIERASLPYLDRLANRVVISPKVKQDYQALYAQQEKEIDGLESRILVINNRLNDPLWNLSEKTYDGGTLKVLFVGRNSPEKRVSLIGQLAFLLRDEPIIFNLVGTGLRDSVAESHRACLNFLGEITDRDKLRTVYKECHVILITSSREGFPLVLAEGMIHGAVPITTRVGGIGWHVRHEQNGYLVENYLDEDKIIEKMSQWLTLLAEDRELLVKLSKAAQEEAYRSFDPKEFTRKWTEQLVRQPI